MIVAGNFETSSINKTTGKNVPLWAGDNDRSRIFRAMKNGRSCKPVRLSELPLEDLREKIQQLRGIRDGSAKSAGTGKRVIVCISTNAVRDVAGKDARDAL